MGKPDDIDAEAAERAIPPESREHGAAPARGGPELHELINHLLAARLRSAALRRVDDPLARAAHLDALDASLRRAIDLACAIRSG